MNIGTLETVWAPRILSVLRIVAALLFFEHGATKLLGFPPSDHSGAVFLSIGWIAGLLELVGGALLIVGLFTRISLAVVGRAFVHLNLKRLNQLQFGENVQQT